MSQPWMPLYVADYLADTRRLTTLEHGVYMLLIMDYWRNGPLPDNDDVLARVVGLTQENWKCARIAIEPLFSLLGGNWTHKRIDEELVKSAEKSKKARDSAANRWKHKNKLDDANALPTQCEGNANAMLSQPQSLDKSKDLPKTKKSKRTQISEEAQPNDRNKSFAEKTGMDGQTFRSEWQTFRSHHRAKGSLMADWNAAWETWCGNWTKFKPRTGPPQKQSSQSLLFHALKRISQDDQRARSPEFFSPDADPCQPRTGGENFEAENGSDARGSGKILDYASFSPI